MAVTAIALFSGLVARLVHLDAGPYGGDERYVVLHALKFGTGDLNPRHFDWPASALYYLTFLIDGCYFVGGYLFGRFRDPAAFALEYLTNPRAYYFIPRAASAVFGLGTIYLLSKATARMVDRQTGILAGLLLLISPLHVQMSRAGLADVPMTFFAVATLYLSLRIATSEKTSTWNYLLAGIMVGLATSMKYNGALAASYVISADLYRESSRLGWRAFLLPARPNLLAAGAASLLAFFAMTPFAILDSRTFLADLSFQFAHQRGAVEHIGIVPPNAPIRELLTSVLPEVVGWPTLLLGAAGIVVTLLNIRRYDLAAIMLIPSLLLEFSAYLMSQVRYMHYLLPIIPCLCVLAAIAIRSIAGRVAKSEWRRGLLTASLLTVILISTIPALAKPVLTLGLPHTGAATMAWVLSHVEPGTKIALDDEEDLNFLPTTASLDRSIAAANVAGFQGRADYYTSLKALIERNEDHPHYDLYRLHVSDRSGGYLDYLRDQHVDYFIRSETVVEMFRRNRPSPATQERLQFYRDIESRCQLVTTIDGDGERLRGRAFQVFKVPPRGQ